VLFFEPLQYNLPDCAIGCLWWTSLSLGADNKEVACGVSGKAGGLNSRRRWVPCRFPLLDQSFFSVAFPKRFANITPVTLTVTHR
jgi:hypothetical protein